MIFWVVASCHMPPPPVKFGVQRTSEIEDTFDHVIKKSCHCALWPNMISHYLVKFGMRKDMWLCSLLLFIVSHHPVTFGGHKSRRNEKITFFVCHVTCCVQVINRLCGFIDNIPSSEAAYLSSLIDIDVVEEEIYFSFVMWSPDHVIKGSREFFGGTPSH